MQTLVWEVPRLALQGTIRTAGTTSTLGVWGNLLAIGSNIVQLVDLSVERVRRIFVADEEPVQVKLATHVHYCASIYVMICHWKPMSIVGST